MTATLLNIFGSLIMWSLRKWIDAQNLKEEQLKSYYEFLEVVDKNTEVDAAQYIAASDARNATKDRIRKRRLAEKKDLP